MCVISRTENLAHSALAETEDSWGFLCEGHMDTKRTTAVKHYHIRWSGIARLDWEPFHTIAEAEASAKQLLREGETYSVEEMEASCARCAKAKAASNY
jgi:hypothetical protein